jgi:hypothetical protein
MQTDSVSILPGLGGGRFGTATNVALIAQTNTTPESEHYRRQQHLIRTADLNGDGRADLIASPGAVLLNAAPSTNRPPTANAGSDRFSDRQVFLSAAAGDADNDWLTFEWRNDVGTVVGRLPFTGTTEERFGKHAFTLTVTDGRGGVATDSVVFDFGRAPGELPSGWTGEDVGDTGATGSSTFDGSVYTIKGAGADIWAGTDAFNFTHTSVTGDFDFTGRIAFIENVNVWTKVGLMLREGTAANARHAFVLATPTTTKGLAFQRRIQNRGSSLSTSGPAIAPPVWLRLIRQGNTVTAFYRTNTSTGLWISIGAQTFFNLAPTVEVGLAISSHVKGTLATANVDGVTLTPLTGGLPEGWSSRDIGTVSAAGSATFDGTTWTVKGSGADIWGTRDEFHYVATSLTDSQENFFEITARVASVQNVNAWTKAGIMLRTSDQPNAPQISLFVTPTTAKGVAFQRRRGFNQESVSTAGPTITAPVWLKLQLWSGSVRAYYRTGTTMPWTFIGEDEIRFESDTVEVGLAVSSHVDGSLATATFDHVSVRGLISAGSTDIGAVGIAGATHDNGVVFTMDASGDDIWNAADAFRFLATDSPNGVSARVLSVENVNPWTKAGVMMRDGDLAPGAPHVMVVVTPGKGIAMQYRATLNGGSTQLAQVTGITAPKWVRLKRTGTTFVGEMSSDGSTWQELGRVDIAMNNPLSGLALTSHDNSQLATASFDDIVLFPSGGEWALLPQLQP